MIGLIFIHGLYGSEMTWGEFPTILLNDIRYKDEIAIKYYVYPSSIVRVPFLSKKSPPIQDLSESMISFLELECSGFDSVLLIAHSMGGLVARNYLLDREKSKLEFPKISGLVMFATPNNGADIASVGKFFSIGNQQLQQLCRDSRFIESLNHNWEKFNVEDRYPVYYFGGLLDDFVSKDSSRQCSENNNWMLLHNKNHTDIVKPVDEKDISYLALSRVLDEHLFNKPLSEGSLNRKYSEELIRQLNLVGKIIEKLTTDQYSVIRYLSGVNRSLIHGCAGSGKTLLAAEKAIRLEKAGFQVLFVCSNPLLAEHLSFLVKDFNVDVYCFYEWIHSILSEDGISRISKDIWSHHLEPTEEEIFSAYERMTKKYDAVIVDEGQDFKDDWWVLLESALKNFDAGVFYIFADDNQSLLPRCSEYPVVKMPYHLGKNCRNSGEIFNVVRRFHPNSPDVSQFLKDKGVYLETRSNTPDLLQSFETAVRDAIEKVGVSNLVVITTELANAESSDLANMVIMKQPPWSWSESVTMYLKKASRLIVSYINRRIQELEKNKSIDSSFDPIGISKSYNIDELKQHCEYVKSLQYPYFRNTTRPTSDDVKLVSRFIRDLTVCFEFPNVKSRNMHWRHKGGRLFLENYVFGEPSLRDLIMLFGFTNWAEMLPPLDCISIIPYSKFKKGMNGIPLYDVASFKGLESEAVVVYVKGSRDKLDANLYVAISRARFYLHLVIDSSAHLKSSRL